MEEDAIKLDAHRGLMAQKATEIRRHRAEFEAEQAALRIRQQEFEQLLLAAPASSWHEAVEKARYLLTLFAATPEAQDPRRQKLISRVLEDFEALSKSET